MSASGCHSRKFGPEAWSGCGGRGYIFRRTSTASGGKLWWATIWTSLPSNLCTAPFAHEIKNPLNFVNNFSGVSVELIDELRQALAGANLDSKLRAEVSEIADTLQGNLDKVVQHGKRADAIVKNMLLHSREGSGEHRLVDINAIVEESLNLAWHGARAEKQGFNVTMKRSLDPAAGQADVFPQDITRVLLNLISNGFYAATKR